MERTQVSDDRRVRYPRRNPNSESGASDRPLNLFAGASNTTTKPIQKRARVPGKTTFLMPGMKESKLRCGSSVDSPSLARASEESLLVDSFSLRFNQSKSGWLLGLQRKVFDATHMQVEESQKGLSQREIIRIREPERNWSVCLVGCLNLGQIA